MPNNIDINPKLSADMTLEHTLHNGYRLFVCAPRCSGQTDKTFLYRSMPLAEALNWFKPEWLPTASGLPWSTNYKYSRDNYLKVDSPVQLEIPVEDILKQMRDVGASPKCEGATGEDETWSSGPASEVGRDASTDTNNELVKLYASYKTDPRMPADCQNLSNGDVKSAGKAKKVQNAIFTLMIKDRIQKGATRVVARLFPPV